MARLRQYGAEDNSTTIGHEINGVNGVTISSSIKRSGNYSYKCTAASSYAFISEYRGDVSQDNYYIRMYLYIDTSLSATATVIDFGAFKGNLAAIKLTSDNKLQLWNTEDNVQVGSDSAALDSNRWYRVEMRFDNTSGISSTYIEARIDGATAFASGTINLAQSSQYGATAFGIVSNTVSGTVYVDDMAINDDSGSYQNEYPGSGRIIRLKVNGDGETVDWTASAGNDYECVDEETPNDITDYISSTTLNQESLFTLDDPPVEMSDSATINTVIVNQRYRGDNASSNPGFKVEIEKESGGTKSLGTEITPTNTTWYSNSTTGAGTNNLPPLITYLDPDGSSWTKATLTTARAGVKITTDNTNSVQVSTLWVNVDYTNLISSVNYVKASIKAATLSTDYFEATFQSQATIVNNVSKANILLTTTKINSSKGNVKYTDQHVNNVKANILTSGITTNNVSKAEISSLAYLDNHSNTAVSSYSNFYGVGGFNEMFAERVKFSRNRVTNIKLYISKEGSPTDNFVLKIVDTPDGTVYATYSIPGTIINGASWDPYDFPINLEVTPGSDYYIQVERSGSRDAVNYFQWTSGSTNHVIETGKKRNNSVWLNADQTSAGRSYQIAYYDEGEQITVRWNKAKAYITRPITDLADNFNDNSLDTSKWYIHTSPITETNGHIEYHTGEIPAYSEEDDIFSSVDMGYDLRESAFSFSVEKFEVTGTFDTLSIPMGVIVLSGDDGYYINFSKSGSNHTIAFFENNGGTPTQRGTTITYDSNIHKWFRIRHSGSTVYFDYSTDCETWTNHASTSSGVVPHACQISVPIYYYNTTIAGIEFDFDNICFYPQIKHNTVKASLLSTVTNNNFAKANIIVKNGPYYEINYVLDPSMENSTPIWTNVYQSGSGAGSHVNYWAAEGSWQWIIQASWQSGWEYILRADNLVLRAGHTYQVSATCFSDWAGVFYRVFRFEKIANPGQFDFINYNFAVAYQYYRVTTNYTPTEDVVLEFNPMPDTTGLQALWYDAVVVTETTNSTYFDGDSTNVYWVGAQDASASTRGGHRNWAKANLVTTTTKVNFAKGNTYAVNQNVNSAKANILQISITKVCYTKAQIDNLERYWVGNGGTWDNSSTTNWSFYSGGSSGAPSPRSNTSVYFDASSFSTTGQTITLNATAECKSLDFTGLDQAVTLSFSGGYDLYVYGNVVLHANLTISQGDFNILYIIPSGNNTLTSAGIFINNIDGQIASGKKLTLADNLQVQDFFLSKSGINGGEFDTGGYDINFINDGYADWTNLTGTGSKITLGDSILTFDGTYGYFALNATLETFDAGTSKIICAASTYTDIYITASHSLYDLDAQAETRIETSGNISHNLNIESDQTLRILAGSTLTLGSSATLTSSAYAGHLSYITTNAAGSFATISKASGDVSVEYFSIKDSHATGGAIFRASHSTNVSGNSGWIFEEEKNNSAKGYIVYIQTHVNSVRANIKTTYTNINTAKANIKTVVTKIAYSKANIQKSGSNVNSVKANILRTGNTKVNYVKARLFLQNITKDVYSKGNKTFKSPLYIASRTAYSVRKQYEAENYGRNSISSPWFGGTLLAGYESNDDLIYRYAAKFILDGLPSNAVLEKAEITFGIQFDTGEQDTYDIKAYGSNGTGDPTTDSDATFYATIGSSATTYVSNNTDIDTIGTYTFDLGSQAITDITSAKAGAGTFSIGIQCDDEARGTHTSAYIGAETIYLKLTFSTGQNNYVKANILSTGTTKINYSKANILLSTQIVNFTKANISGVGISNVNFVKANIKLTVTKINSVKASIVVTGQNVNYVKANILYAGNTRVNIVKANVKKAGNTAINYAKSNVKNTYINGEFPTSSTSSPGTMANDSSVGTTAWLNPDNAKLNDGNTANHQNGAPTPTTSYYLKATNFGFSIPAGSVIHGILVEVEKNNASVGSGVDNSVKIVKADGSFGSENKAIAGEDGWINTTDVYTKYGGALDTWGESWTYADINDPDFGFAISTTLTGSFVSLRIDHIRITVYYTEKGSIIKANIINVGISNTNIVKANIRQTYANDNFAKASLVVTRTNDNLSKADILTAYTKINYSKGSINTSGQQANYVTGNILQTYTKDCYAKAQITYFQTYDTYSKGSIIIYASKINYVKASIVVSNSFASVSKANILKTIVMPRDTGVTLGSFSNGNFDTNLSSWIAGKKPNTISGLLAWYDISQEVGLSDGNLISTINDWSGNGYEVTQGNSSYQSTYETGEINGLPVARVTSGDRYVDTQFSSLTGNSKWYAMIVAMKKETTGGNYAIMKFGDVQGATCGGYVLGTQYGAYTLEHQHLKDGTGYAWSGWYTITQNQFFIAGYGYDQAKKWGYGNGARSSTSFTIQDVDVGGISLFTSADGDVGQWGHIGDFGEAFLFNDYLSDADIADLHAYLGLKYGITLTERGANISRDTGTKYAGAASMKVVTLTQTDVYESVNFSGGGSVELTAYAYTTGAEVTSSDVQLFYNGSAQSTTYTSVGSGWYKLTATIAVTSGYKNIGAQVKASKTVYLDSFSLSGEGTGYFSRGNVLQTYTSLNSSKASVVTTNTNVNYAKGNIRIQTEEQINYAKASIVVLCTNINSAKANISAQHINIFKANILTVYSKINYAKSNIVNAGQVVNNAKGNIKNTYTYVCYSKGQIVYKQSQVNYAKARITPYLHAFTFTANAGTISSGSIFNTFAIDASYFVLTELAPPNSPAFDYEFGFVDVPGFNLQLHFTGRYQGNPGHIVKFQQWNYTLGQWDDVTSQIRDLSSDTVDETVNYELLASADHLQNGRVRIKILHTTTGLDSHLLYIDDIHLEPLTIFVNSVKANIKATTNQINFVKANIKQAYTFINYVKASIIQTRTNVNFVRFNILKSGNTNINYVKANILLSTSVVNYSKSNIVKTVVQPRDSTFDLSYTTNLFAWYKADAQSYNENDSVTSVVDSSGNGNTLSSAGTAPIYKTNVLNGKPVFRFNNNGRLTRTSSVTGQPTGNADLSMIIVMTPSAQNFNDTPINIGTDGSGSAVHFIYRSSVDNKWHFDVWGSTAECAFGTVNVGETKILTGVKSGSDRYTYTNGTYNNTHNRSTNIGANSIQVGDLTANGLYFSGDIAEVLMFSEALSSSNRKIVEDYLYNKYLATGYFAKGNIPGIKNVSSKANILAPQTKLNYVKAFIFSTGNQIAYSKANVWNTYTYDSYAKGQVVYHQTADCVSKANILQSSTASQYAKANIRTTSSSVCYLKANIVKTIVQPRDTNPTNYALHFDGSDDYIGRASGTIVPTNTDYTIEFWVKWQYAGNPPSEKDFYTTHSIGSSSASSFLGVQSGGNFRGYTCHPSSCYFVPFSSTSWGWSQDNWYHIAYSRNSADNKFYVAVNGVWEGPVDIAETDLAQGTTGLFIGGGYFGRMHMVMDEFRISNVHRYTLGENFSPTFGEFDLDANTLALYHFNEGDGTTVYDATDNHYDLTFQESTVPTWVDSQAIEGQGYFSKSNILVANNTKINLTKANIKASISTVCYSKANINNTYSDIVIVKANIISSYSNVQYAKGYILSINAINCYSKANIKTEYTKVAYSKAFIFSTGYVVNLSKANIRNTYDAVCFSKASIYTTESKACFAKGNIKASSSNVNYGKGSIVVSESRINTVKANIKREIINVITVKANIKQSASRVCSVKANILKQNNTNSNFVKANLRRSYSSVNDVKASIKTTGTAINYAKAYIFSANINWSNYVKGNILKINNTQVNYSKANVSGAFSFVNIVHGNIVVTNTKIDFVKADILQTYTDNNNSKASIVRTESYINVSRGDILRSYTFDQNSKGHIKPTRINYAKADILVINSLNNFAKASIVTQAISYVNYAKAHLKKRGKIYRGRPYETKETPFYDYKVGIYTPKKSELV